MSYCRFGNADVYVFEHVYGGIDCCGCWLDPQQPRLHSMEEVEEHFAAHVAAGHNVPDTLVADIRADANDIHWSDTTGER